MPDFTDEESAAIPVLLAAARVRMQTEGNSLQHAADNIHSRAVSARDNPNTDPYDRGYAAGFEDGVNDETA